MSERPNIYLHMDAFERAFAVFQKHDAQPHPVDGPFVFGLLEYLRAITELGLVVYLRDIASKPHYPPDAMRRAIGEAADRIVELEAALRELMQYVPLYHEDDDKHARVHAAIRRSSALLEGKPT